MCSFTKPCACHAAGHRRLDSDEDMSTTATCSSGQDAYPGQLSRMQQREGRCSRRKFTAHGQTYCSPRQRLCWKAVQESVHLLPVQSCPADETSSAQAIAATLLASVSQPHWARLQGSWMHLHRVVCEALLLESVEKDPVSAQATACQCPKEKAKQ